MGEISTSVCSEVEKIKQLLMDEFKIHQRMIRLAAVECQVLLRRTAVRLTNGLESVYKENLLRLDEVASKLASGDDVEQLLSKEFIGDFRATYDFNIAELKTAIESWNVSLSKGCTDSYVPMSRPSFATGTEVRVDVFSGITKQGIFWLNLQELPESNQLALGDLYKRISLEMLRDKEWKSFEESKSSPNVGDYVLVNAWNGWARGKIEKLKDDNTFAVRLVDYGDLISCGTGLLLPMKTDLYPDADYQSLRCCLSLDCDPMDLSIEAVWAFNDLLRENSLVKNPVVCIFKNKHLGKDNEEIWQVDLMVKDKKGNTVSVSQAVNKKIEDTAKGRDSIACRDIRYSANECTVSRYVERPAESNGGQKSIETEIGKPAETAKQMTSEEHHDTAPSGNGSLHELLQGELLQRELLQGELLQGELLQGEQLQGEQLVADELQEVLCENSAQSIDEFICVPGNNASIQPVSFPCQLAVSETNVWEPGLHNEQSVLTSTIPSASTLDLQNLLCSKASYSPPIASSETVAVTVDRHSTLKPDAAPFVSRSLTNLDPLENPAPLSPDPFVLYQPENFSDCDAQERSVMEMEMEMPQYCGPAVNLHFPNYAGAKPLEFGGNLRPVMQEMIYQTRGPAYSYMPPTFNAIPVYPVHGEVEQSGYSQQEMFAPGAHASERKFDEPNKVDNLLPAVCSTKGTKFSGHVTSQMEADGTFWIQLSRNDQKEVEAWNRVQATLSTCNKLMLPIASEEVVPGLMATVQSSQTGELYRTEVLSIRDRKAVLRCIDYGKTIVAPRDTLKPLVDKVRNLPRQAVQCRLYRSSSDGDQAARKLFDGLVKSGPIMATVVSVEPGNPETLVVELLDSIGRNVADEMVQSRFSQRLCSRDDSGDIAMPRSLGAFSASASLSDTAAMSSIGPGFPFNLPEQSSAYCEPVKKLMAIARSGSASLVDVTHASLPLGSLPCDLRVPPPAIFSQMGDTCDRIVLVQNYTHSPQKEWNNQQVKAENQTDLFVETSTVTLTDRNNQLRRNPWQQRCRDDEQRSIPPFNMRTDDTEYRQQMAEDDQVKYDKKHSGCFNCGEFGHVKKFCPKLQQPKKTHGGSYGRTNSRK